MASFDDEEWPPKDPTNLRRVYHSRRPGISNNVLPNITNAYQNPPMLTRSFTTPATFTTPAQDTTTSPRPPLKQPSSASEEIIQRTKSGLLDLTGKGKVTFQQAGRELNEFRGRVLGRRGSSENGGTYTEALLRPGGRGENERGIERESLLIDFSDEEESPSASINSAPEPKSAGFDRKEIEKQIADHLQNLKSMSLSALRSVSSVSQSALGSMSNATQSSRPSIAGSAGGSFSGNMIDFDTPANSTRAWQTTPPRSITERMTEDMKDYALHIQGFWGGLCSRCEKFPTEKMLNSKTETEFVFETPLERILCHSNWCRLCAYFLRNLCRAENDPFQHSQIRKYLQPHLKGKAFAQWVALGQEGRRGDANWPFGHGTQMHEGAFNYIDTVTLKRGAKERASSAATYLIPMMIKVAMSRAASQNTPCEAETLPLSSSRGPSRRGSSGSWEERSKESNSGGLKYPLECVLKVKIRTNLDLRRTGQVQASLLGYGRGYAAEMATLSQFQLRLQTEPTFGSIGSPLRYGFMVNSGQVDITTAATWLHECQTNHGAKCKEQAWAELMKPPPIFRVIDTQDCCITTISEPKNTRFIALSYVWGRPAVETLLLSQDNISQLSGKNGLLHYWHGVPTTVKDAMLAVQGMGERYLWVDALCVLQDIAHLDRPSGAHMDAAKQAQLKAIDWIYSHALFTIVAATSPHSMFGIAGIRPDTRSLKQDTVSLPSSPGSRLLTPITVPVSTDDTIWETRAWTLPDKLLSKRLLIFQGGHMIWHCRSATSHEDMPSEDKGPADLYPLLPWPTFPRHFLSSPSSSIHISSSTNAASIIRSDTFHQYTSIVAQYTSRVATNDNDVLNAFASFAQLFRELFRFPIRFGIPEILLDVAILWLPAEALERRRFEREGGNGETIPSWSWAGWKGRVRYEAPFTARVDELMNTMTRRPVRAKEIRRERIRPCVRWHILSKTTGELTLLNKTGLGVPLFGKVPKEWEIIQDRDERLTMSDLSPRMRQHIGPQHLVFRTRILDNLVLGPLQIEEDDEDEGEEDDEHENPPHRHTLLSSEGNTVGTMLLDGDDLASLTDLHSFVVVSEAQYYGLEFEMGVPEDTYPLYNVLLVEWNAARTAARRVGLGRVDKKAWDGEWEVVCLE